MGSAQLTTGMALSVVLVVLVLSELSLSLVQAVAAMVVVRVVRSAADSIVRREYGLTGRLGTVGGICMRFSFFAGGA